MSKYKQLTKETKAVIKVGLDILLDQITETVYQGQLETDCLNSNGFWERNEEILEIANEYIIAYLEGENLTKTNDKDKDKKWTISVTL